MKSLLTPERYTFLEIGGAEIDDGSSSTGGELMSPMKSLLTPELGSEGGDEMEELEDIEELDELEEQERLNYADDEDEEDSSDDTERMDKKECVLQARREALKEEP